MISAVYGWVADILSFLILMGLLETLLPSGKYARYIRFFAGMVLILVAAGPLNNILGLTGRIDNYFAEFSFQAEARDLRQEILGIERERLEQVIAGCEEEAAKGTERLVREAGLVPVETHVEIVKDADSADYGAVARVVMTVAEGADERQGADGGPASGAQQVADGGLDSGTQQATGGGPASGAQQATESGPASGAQQGTDGGLDSGTQQVAGGSAQDQESGENSSRPPARTPASGGNASAVSVTVEVEPVEIRVDAAAKDERAAGASATTGDAAAGNTPSAESLSGAPLPSRQSRLRELRRKVEDYYGLEPENVEIQLEGR